jgi:hypothetical protein
MEQTEKWLPVQGYEGRYDVSDHGRVRSLPRVVGHQERPGRIMRTEVQPKGNHRIVLNADGKKRNHQVNRLVWLAFVGPVPKRFYVGHLDGNLDNNQLGNLTLTARRPWTPEA